MTTDQAKALVVQSGKMEGKRLAACPMWYLKWMGRSHSHSAWREAAALVVASRGEDLGEAPAPKREKKMLVPVKEYREPKQGAFGDLEKILKEAKEDLF